MLICLSSGFLSVAIFSKSIEIQSWLGTFISWCSHEFISRLIVVINADRC